MSGRFRFLIAFSFALFLTGGQFSDNAHAADLPEPAPEPSRLIPAMPTLAMDTYRDRQVDSPLALRQSYALQEARLASGKKENKQEKSPAFITADSVTGQAGDITLAEGNVELRTAQGQAYADKVSYYPLTDEFEASGNVRLLQDGAEVNGSYMRLRIADRIGHFDEARYQIHRQAHGNKKTDQTNDNDLLPALPHQKGTAFGQASRVNFEGENHFRLENASYSTCRPESEDWYVKGEEIKLDYDRSEGEARNATLYFKDTPIFYTPYFSFPLNDQRESGFLMPTYASTTSTGIDFSLPYYWNVAPNYDATFTSRLMSKRGMQLGSELRYLNHYANTSLQLEYLQHDQQYRDRRYSYNWRHTHNLGGGFSARADWNRASDDEYFTDLSSRVVQTAQRQLPQDFNLNYAGNGYSLNLRTLRYQTLNPSKEQTLDLPYFMLPQIHASTQRMLPFGLDLNAFGQYTYFDHQHQEKGSRALLYPQLSLPFIRPGHYVTPKVGLYMSRYQLSKREPGLPDNLSLALPVFSLDAGLTFERETSLLGRGWTQTLEPRFYYVLIPYRNQNRFPVFDTGLTDFNFGQIFSENRFSGYDRINNANQITTALTSRLINPSTGAENIRAMVGLRHYLTNLKVGLPGEDNLSRDKTSSLLTAFSGQIWARTYADMALERSFKHSSTQRVTVSMRYQPAYGQSIAASYRYNRGFKAAVGASEPMKQIDIAGQWQLSNRWYAVGRYNYSFDTSRLIEGIAGMEYRASCWVARFVTQRLETTAGSPNTSIFFQIELNDFAQIGSNPIQLLRRSIPGYTKINELPELSPGSIFPNE